MRKPAAILLTPVDTKVALQNVNDKIIFRWELLKDVNPENVIIQVADNKELDNSDDILITPDTVNGLTYHFKQTGRYYWRIHYIGKKRDVMSSLPVFVDVDVPNPLPSPKIYKNYNLVYRTRKGKEVYQMEWEDLTDSIGYVLEVYKDASLRDLVLRKKTDSNNFVWEGRTSGQYYYRVKALGTAGRISDFSSIGKLIFPIAPLAD